MKNPEGTRFVDAASIVWILLCAEFILSAVEGLRMTLSWVGAVTLRPASRTGFEWGTRLLYNHRHYDLEKDLLHMPRNGAGMQRQLRLTERQTARRTVSISVPTLRGNSRVPPQRHTENYSRDCPAPRNTNLATRDPRQMHSLSPGGNRCFLAIENQSTHFEGKFTSSNHYFSKFDELSMFMQV